MSNAKRNKLMRLTVHRALRLSFQDAIGFSFDEGPKAGGGADGSIITFEETELLDREP